MNATAEFQDRLNEVAKDIDVLLDRLLGHDPEADEVGRPRRLLEAMRYASLGAGKRFRPFLVAESAALFGVARQHALMAGAALECVHCYSLVHDDLPAMDNDELRRGQPTVHKAFDEATAILAGDGLLTFAFDILARPETHPNPAVRVELVLALARASGLGGMAGGQMLDLAAEGRFADGRAQRLQESEVATLQAMKTGALLKFALPCRRHPRPGNAPRNVTRSIATARRSARRFRSPTIFSTSKAIRPWSASRPARTRPPARRPWSAFLGPRARKRGCTSLSMTRRNRWRHSAPQRMSSCAAAKFVADRHA